MNNAELQEKWTPEQKSYIDFLAAKKRDQSGNKYTDEQFATMIGLNPSTLYRWKRLPGFRSAVLEEKLSRVVDYIPAMLDAQVAKSIKQGDTAAFKEVLRALELLKADKVQTDVNINNIDAVTSLE